MFSSKALGGIVPGGVVGVLKQDIRLGRPGLALVLFNCQILSLILLSITIDAYGEGSTGVLVFEFDGLSRP